MRVLILSRYDRQGASSRLRTMQYVPLLEAYGFHVDISPLLSSDYLQEMYLGRRSWANISQAFLRRMRQARSKVDLIWLEKEMLPWAPLVLEQAAWPDRTPVVTDYDDAIFHRYDRSSNWLTRKILGRKIDSVMRTSDLVLAGNEYLAERARRAGSVRVEIAPTVVDISRYATGSGKRLDGRLRLGWIGTPETWKSFASSYESMLAKLAAEHGAVVRLVGAGDHASVREPFEVLAWSEDTEVESIQGMDIGLMPLPDTPWTRGKCGYKLIQYMACGLPVVASPVGVNAEIVEHGVNGFLASSEAEWVEVLDTLIADPDLRRRMGAAGRKKVEDHYSLQVQGPRVARLLAEVAQSAQAL